MGANEAFWPMTDRQRELQQKARAFAAGQITPVVEQLDQTAKFAADIYRKMARQGLLGITIPRDWGGAGADAVAYALVMEELSVGYASIIY